MVIKPEYKPFVIKNYVWWTLLLNEQQYPYIGRCYAWWDDRSGTKGEGLRPSDLPVEALLELNHTIFEDVIDACRALGYKADPYGERFLLNTCYLANEPVHNHHMHWHFIPRHDGELVNEKLCIKQVGVNWGKNYAPTNLPPGNLEAQEIAQIRNIMATALGSF